MCFVLEEVRVHVISTRWLTPTYVQGERGRGGGGGKIKKHWLKIL